MRKKTAKLSKPKRIYEDENWLVFDKPAGVVAHPSNQHMDDLSMNDYLEKYCSIKNIAQE
jgi:23S rRNA-/tRNA-specific pseudouridylate synthase